MVKRRWRCKLGQQPTEFDKRIMYLENKGALVPTPDLIKTPEQLEGIRRAGVVNTGVLDAVEQEICAGMSTLEIDQICRDYCALHGAIPACLNYDIEDGETPPFPMSVCTSINEVVCHGIPKAEDILEALGLGKRHRQSYREARQALPLRRRPRSLRPWGRVCLPRRTRSGSFPAEGQRNAPRSGNGVHHRTDD